MGPADGIVGLTLPMKILTPRNWHEGGNDPHYPREDSADGTLSFHEGVVPRNLRYQEPDTAGRKIVAGFLIQRRVRGIGMLRW